VSVSASILRPLRQLPVVRIIHPHQAVRHGATQRLMALRSSSSLRFFTARLCARRAFAARPDRALGLDTFRRRYLAGSDARFARPHPTPTRVRKCAKCHPRLPESILRAARPQRLRTLRTHTYLHALTNSLSLSSRRSVKILITAWGLRHKHGPSVNTPRWSRGSSEHGRAGPASSLGMPIRRARSPTSSVPLTTTRDSSPRPTCCRTAVGGPRAGNDARDAV